LIIFIKVIFVIIDLGGERGGSDEDIGILEVCLRHFMYEKVNLREVYGEGYGNCRICTRDTKNKQCKGYVRYYLPTYKGLNQPTR